MGAIVSTHGGFGGYSASARHAKADFSWERWLFWGSALSGASEGLGDCFRRILSRSVYRPPTAGRGR
jgi:hypothetical protein